MVVARAEVWPPIRVDGHLTFHVDHFQRYFRLPEYGPDLVCIWDNAGCGLRMDPCRREPIIYLTGRAAFIISPYS